jgi:hypothetical protein
MRTASHAENEKAIEISDSRNNPEQFFARRGGHFGIVTFRTAEACEANHRALENAAARCEAANKSRRLTRMARRISAEPQLGARIFLQLRLLKKCGRTQGRTGALTGLDASLGLICGEPQDAALRTAAAKSSNLG